MIRRFEGKMVVVTGGNRGIGYAIAERFAQEGACIAMASVEEQVQDAAAGREAATGVTVLPVLCDVSKVSDVRALYQLVEERLGGVDVSIQNAGIITIARVENLTEAEWDSTMDVSTKGVFLCCQDAIRSLRRTSKAGRLINTASGQARAGFIYTPHYAASKFGVMGLTQSLAKEVALEGITVNAICPGIIETDMWDYNDRVWGQMLGDYGPGELMAEWVQDILMKRAGKGRDVAGLVVFLASDDAEYITGQTINVDGGLIMS